MGNDQYNMGNHKPNNDQSGFEDISHAKMNRRDFLKRSAIVVSGMGAVAASLSPLKQIEEFASPEEFFQKHYKELTPREMDKVLKRIADQVEEKYSVRPNIRDVKPMDGVEFSFALNLTKCNGSRRCVHACVAENNQSRNPEIQYIRVLKIPVGSRDVEHSQHHYAPDKVPEEGFYYIPIQCQQCKNPPCVKVCPVEATWQEPDGVTVIDYNWCIGCRYCEAACPYWARRFNFAEPQIPQDQLNPNMSYLSNRPRPRGVVEKCHFCLHRTREGKFPACLEACPTGARIFGNVLDPDSEISYVLKNKRVFVLKEEVNTLPRFYYYFDK